MFKLVKSLIFTPNFRLRHKKTYISTMNKAYLRHVIDDDTFQITFQYNNPELMVDRQFNFSRRLSEPVSAFLTRVTVNVQKAINKKTNKKNLENVIPVEVNLLLNNEQVENDVICQDLFKQGNLVKLKLLNVEYEIIIDSPFIDAITLPHSMLANFPVYPSKFESVFTNKKLSEFLWYRSSDKKQWEQVGSGFIFTPENSDINYYLKISCIPRNEKAEGPIIEAVTKCPVNASPGVCPFELRHQFTQNKCTKDEFRVVSYNILADLYCDSDYTRNVLHPYCPPYALALDYRKQLFLKEIIGYKADIICLQEVDRKVFYYDLRAVLGSMDYDSHFTEKGASVAEGVACFYDTKRFDWIDEYGIILSEELNTNPILEDIWKNIRSNRKLADRILERQTAFQCTVLKSKENGNILLVANTHLYFHPDADHIRLIQSAICIRYLEHIYKETTIEYEDKKISVIFCGDFNSVPECGIFKFYTTGQIGSDCIDWSSNVLEAVKDLSLSQPFTFDSACGTPKYTNFTTGFADCLDYIFYDKSMLEVAQVIPLPSNDELTQNTALPSIVFPSDHVALVADLKWIK